MTYKEAAKFLEKSEMRINGGGPELSVIGTFEEIKSFLNCFGRELLPTTEDCNHIILKITDYKDIMKILTYTGPHTNNSNYIYDIIEVIYELPEKEKNDVWPLVCIMCEWNKIPLPIK
jgi:hypothetical protein